MKLPVLKAFGATLAYLARHWPDLLKAMWLPALLLVAVQYYAVGPLLTGLGALIDLGETPDTSEALAALSGLGKWSLILIAGSALFHPMLTAASLRHLIRGDALQVPFYLRFGGDELRILGAYVLLSLMVLLISMVGELGVAAVSAILAVASPNAKPAVQSLGELIVNVVTLWFQLRLCTLFAASLATRTTGFGAAWAATKGQVVRLLGFWFLIGVVYVPLALLLVSPFIAEIFPLMMKLAGTGGDQAAAKDAANAVIAAVAGLFSPDHPRFWMTAVLLYLAALLLPALANVAAGTAWRYLSGAAAKPSAGGS